MNYDSLGQQDNLAAQREETLESSSSGSLSPLPEQASSSSNEFENEESQYNEEGSLSREPAGTPRSDEESEHEQSAVVASHGAMLDSPQLLQQVNDSEEHYDESYAEEEGSYDQRGVTEQALSPGEGSLSQQPDQEEADEMAEMEEIVNNREATIAQLEQEQHELRRRRGGTTREKLADAEEEVQELRQEIGRLKRAKTQAESFASKFRMEKNKATRAEDDMLRSQEQVDALSEQVEKLMTHLHHESRAKAKAYDAHRRMERECERMKQRVAQLARANQEKEQMLLEVKEGSKILEDQLRLMDEKYIDLRGKLDWTRNNSWKQVRRAYKEVDRIRREWLSLQREGHVTRAPPPMPKVLRRADQTRAKKAKAARDDISQLQQSQQRGRRMASPEARTRRTVSWDDDDRGRERDDYDWENGQRPKSGSGRGRGEESFGSDSWDNEDSDHGARRDGHAVSLPSLRGSR